MLTSDVARRIMAL